MEQNLNSSQFVIDTINTIFKNLFTSIDTNLFKILDELVFINTDILQDKYFGKIFGTSATNGILLISNALIIGFIIYFAIKYFSSNFNFSKIENPMQFILKLIIFTIAMNFSYFIITQILDINANLTAAIKSIGEDLFRTNISFSKLIVNINSNLKVTEDNLNVFSLEGIFKGAATISLLNLITTYAVRYIMLKILILISPFAILSLCMEKTKIFFKLWIKNTFSLLAIQIVVALVLLILFSLDFKSEDLMVKIIYVGGIYALTRANSFVKNFMMGGGGI